jgi:hypothetical protein
MEISREFKSRHVVVQLEHRHILATSESYSEFHIVGEVGNNPFCCNISSVLALGLMWNSLSSVLIDLTSWPRSSVLKYEVDLPSSYNFCLTSVQYCDGIS